MREFYTSFVITLFSLLFAFALTGGVTKKLLIYSITFSLVSASIVYLVW